MSASRKTAVPLLALLLAAAGAVAGGLIGGRSEASMDDQGVKNALQYAVVQHNKGSNDLFVSQVTKVVKIEKQLVSGMKYYFTVEMARTSCRKGGVETLCAVHEDPEIAVPFECKFEVWSRPWKNSIEVLKNSCIQ